MSDDTQKKSFEAVYKTANPNASDSDIDAAFKQYREESSEKQEDNSSDQKKPQDRKEDADSKNEKEKDEKETPQTSEPASSSDDKEDSWKDKARIWENRAIENKAKLEEYEKKISDLKKLEEDNNSLKELLEKANEEKTSYLKFKLARENNLPDAALDLLTGKTEEELSGSAKKLSDMIASISAGSDSGKTERTNVVRTVGVDSESNAPTGSLMDLIKTLDRK